MQPTTEHWIATEGSGESGEVRKDLLADILGEVRVSIHPSQSGGVNQVKIAADDFSKGIFRTSRRVFREQLLHIRHSFLLL